MIAAGRFVLFWVGRELACRHLRWPPLEQWMCSHLRRQGRCRAAGILRCWQAKLQGAGCGLMAFTVWVLPCRKWTDPAAPAARRGANCRRYGVDGGLSGLRAACHWSGFGLTLRRGPSLSGPCDTAWLATRLDSGRSKTRCRHYIATPPRSLKLRILTAWSGLFW